MAGAGLLPFQVGVPLLSHLRRAGPDLYMALLQMEGISWALGHSKGQWWYQWVSLWGRARFALGSGAMGKGLYLGLAGVPEAGE